ncbi:MAG: MBOAT family protein [Bacteroides sp.]|nr:MBOAT family protein [Bacteroides sp.]
MLFNSLEFLVFFPTVVILYWILTPRLRNPMLLIASYYFYMNWQPVYALLILLSTLTTYLGAILINDKPEHKKVWIWGSISINISILFLFKYLTFAADSIQHLMDSVGIGIQLPQFTLLLPVGISFYTFQAVGYLIEVYRHDIRAERNFMTYALFVSFFPQLVAGPIERAKNLLPQFHTQHHFNGDHLIAGLKTMVWGYFMKLCIAESVAPYVNAVFNNIGMHGCTSIWLATFFFTFQIFCDFGGYSLIAIGTARCVGFNLMQNFRQPYLARNVKDFWRRWHISLSSWLSDYIYKPLGGSRCSTARHQRNLIITFLVSGFWHGANWTFVAWGAYHGLLQSGLSLKKRYVPAPKQRNPIITIIGVVTTFILMMLGWVLFRANSWTDAMTAYHKMFHPDGAILYNGEGKPAITLSLFMIGLLMLKELRDDGHYNLRFTSNPNLLISGFWTAVLIFIIFLCAHFESGQFIYFQF